MSETAPPCGGITDPASADSAADGITHSLDRRWIRYRRQVGWAGSAVLALGLATTAVIAVVTAFVPAAVAGTAAVVVAVTFTVLSQVWPAVAYRYASYRLGGRALEIRRGVLWRSVIDVPRSRIQHSDVSQGPLERVHGLGTLSVFTAGTKYALVRLHGLDHDRALAMREHLLRTDEDDVI